MKESNSESRQPTVSDLDAQGRTRIMATIALYRPFLGAR